METTKERTEKRKTDMMDSSMKSSKYQKVNNYKERTEEKGSPKPRIKESEERQIKNKKFY